MQAGTRLGHYEILEPLGAGGMGEVYLGLDSRLGRKVAIKVLPAEFASDPERLARFEQEARAAAALNHPHIAVVHDVGSVPGEEGATTHFMVQEYLEGETLTKRLETGALPLKRALALATEVGEALIAAHKAGIIHRDLKPDNIFVTEQGHAKVLDFGLAKLTEMAASAGSGASMSPTMLGTMAGQVMGTAGYMAPEQVQGEGVDPRADLFAFGSVLYEAITGTQPFAGKSIPDTLSRILHDEPAPLAEVDESLPLELQRIVKKCLAKEPAKRYQTAGDLVVDLRALGVDVESGAAVPVGGRSVVAPGVETTRGIPWKRAAPIAALIAVAAASSVWVVTRPALPAPESPMRLAVKLAEVGIDQAVLDFVLSPNGTRIAYTVFDFSNQTKVLYVRSLDRLEGMRLTSDDAGLSGGPFFSPDGEWVGFFTASGLSKVPVTGGTPQTICSVSSNAGASWGPDDTIIFGTLFGGLFRVSADGGEAEPLIQPEGEGSDRWPQVLPGGKAVLFTSYASIFGTSAASIEVLDLETRARKVVHRGGSHGRYVAPGHLVYLDQGTLFAEPFDLGELEVTGSAVPTVQGIVTIPYLDNAQFSFAGRGTLAYVSGGVDAEQYPVVWVDRQGNTTPLWDEPGAYGDPQLSPDGTRLALAVFRDDNMDVWIYDMERGVPSRLTFDAGRDDDHVWSPDGQYLAFASDRNLTQGIYQARADGSGEAELLTTEGAPQSWSADGRFLAYVKLDPQTGADIWVLPLEGDREPQVFANTNANEVFAVFSPNGRWIAYQSDESDNAEVYVQSYPPGLGKWQVSSNGGNHPRWSGDGRQIFYRNTSRVMVVAVEIEADSFSYGSAEQLFAGDFRGGTMGMVVDGEPYWGYDVTADGQRFVMFPGAVRAPVGSDHVTLVLNWFEELKQRVPGRR